MRQVAEVLFRRSPFPHLRSPDDDTRGPSLLCKIAHTCANLVISIAERGNCKNGVGLCDHSHLTLSETNEVTTAEHKRNAQNCENGWDECDHSKLTPVEGAQISAAEHQRNIAACRVGDQACDYAELTPAEAKALADTEHKRNYAACLSGYGYCDPRDLRPGRLIRSGRKPIDSR